MNHKPQSFTVLPWLAAATNRLALASALMVPIPASLADESQPPADPAPSVATTPAAEQLPVDASPDPAAQPGDELLTQVRAKLEGLESLKCELHQTAMISGMKLSALGRYTEASGNRVHLQYLIVPLSSAKSDDAKILAMDAEPLVIDEADSRGILTQVSDGEVLHTSWKNGKTVRITRRSIRDILAAALTSSNYDPKNAAMDLGIGGLRGLISRLQSSMEFAPVKSVKVGERDFLEVTGRWNPHVRTDVFKLPEGTVTIPQLQIPEYVRIFVDAQTLLPRRIQYLKRSIDPTQNAVRPMITLDLRNLVLNEPVEDQLFAFQAPGNTPEEDQTAQIIQAIQQSDKSPAQETTSSAAAPATPPAAAPGKD